MSADAHKHGQFLKNVPVHPTGIAAAAAYKYEVYQLDLNAAGPPHSDLRKDWVQGTQQLLKTKVPKEALCNITDVSWFWRTDTVLQDESLSIQVESHFGIPSSDAELLEFVINKYYKDTDLQTLEVTKSTEDNDGSPVEVYTLSIDNQTEPRKFVQEKLAGSLMREKTSEEFYQEVPKLRRTLRDSFLLLHRFCPIGFKDMLFRGGFRNWIAFSSMLLSYGATSRKKCKPDLRQLRALLCSMPKFGLSKLDSTILNAREDCLKYMSKYTNFAHLGEGNSNPMSFSGTESYSPFLNFDCPSLNRPHTFDSTNDLILKDS